MSIDQRIRDGLNQANVAAPVPDIESALAAVVARGRQPHRRPVVAALVAAAAAVLVVAGVLAVTRDEGSAPAPIAPTPSPSVTPASPGPDDHPISLFDGDGVPVLVTLGGSDRVGTATLWRQDADGWRRLGTLEHAVVPEGVDGRTHLLPGPGGQDLVALGLADDRVGFSRDGGATWSYLAQPKACGNAECSAIFTTTTHLYVDVPGGAVRAAFGATAWEELSLPSGTGSPDRRTGLLVLDDVLLNIASDCDTVTNHYWVSQDAGDTWSARRDFPANTCIYRPLGNTVYTADAAETQWWRSTDLATWEQAPASEHDERAKADAACPGLLGRDPSDERLDESPVRVGDEVYKIFHLSSRSHDLELRVSHDRCRTWQPVL